MQATTVVSITVLCFATSVLYNTLISGSGNFKEMSKTHLTSTCYSVTAIFLSKEKVIWNIYSFFVIWFHLGLWNNHKSLQRRLQTWSVPTSIRDYWEGKNKLIPNSFVCSGFALTFCLVYSLPYPVSYDMNGHDLKIVITLCFIQVIHWNNFQVVD